MKTDFKIWTVLIIVGVLVLVDGIKDLSVDNSIIIKTLIYVIQNIKFDPAYSFYVIFSSSSVQSSFEQNFIINNLLLILQEKLIVRLEDSSNNSSDFSGKNKFTLLLIDSLESFEKLDQGFKNLKYHRSGKHLILLTRQLDKDDTMFLISKVFKEFFLRNIMYVELMLKNYSTGVMEFYTFYPITPKHCFNSIPVLHNTFDGIQLKNGWNLFPRKLDNFFLCHLTLITFPFPPHVILKHEGNIVKGSGIDVNVLKGISKKLNFTVRIIDSGVRGVQDENGTLSGALKLLDESYGNITIGGYGATSKVMLRFSRSRAYLHASMVVAIPPLREYSPLEKLILPFDFSVWIAIGLIFGITFIISKLLSKAPKNYKAIVFGSTVKYPFYEMIVVYLGGAVARFPENSIARNMILQWLIVSTILSSCYKAVLFGMLKTGFLKKYPTTIVEMLDLGYVLDVPMPLMPTFKEGIFGSRNSFFLLKHSLHTHYNIIKKRNVNRMVVDTSIQLQYFNSLNFKTGILNSLPQRLFQFPMYFYYRKDSFLVDPFDSVIQKFIESGLISYWQKSVLGMRFKESAEVSNIMNPLNVSDFQSCFLICGILAGVSVIVFLFELLSKHVNLKNKKLFTSQITYYE